MVRSDQGNIIKVKKHVIDEQFIGQDELREVTVYINDRTWVSHMVGESIYEILSVPAHINGIICSSNHIERLTTPDGFQFLTCNNNPLKELNLSGSMKELECNNTDLTSLELNEGLERLDCRFTNIGELVLPFSIKELRCDNTVNIKNFDRVLEYNSDIDISMEDPLDDNHDF